MEEAADGEEFGVEDAAPAARDEIVREERGLTSRSEHSRMRPTTAAMP